MTTLGTRQSKADEYNIFTNEGRSEMSSFQSESREEVRMGTGVQSEGNMKTIQSLESRLQEVEELNFELKIENQSNIVRLEEAEKRIQANQIR